MTKVEKQFNDVGNSVFVSPKNKSFSPTLALGFYSVKFHMEQGFYLDKQNGFNLPSKMYGCYQDRIDRIIRTYKRRSGNTGVLLEGVKGAGKTVLMKQLCNQLVSEYPVVTIDSPFSGESFSRFIESLGPCVLVIDEFEKIYNKEDYQNSLLTLFDGTFNTNNLILITVNDSGKVVNQFHGRPGRIYLRYSFGKLEKSIVEEVCNDLLEKDSHKKSIMNYYLFKSHFTFDILMTLIDELLHENFDNFDEFISPLNIDEKSGIEGVRANIVVYHKKFGNSVIYKGTERLSNSENIFNLFPENFEYYLENSIKKESKKLRIVSDNNEEDKNSEILSFLENEFKDNDKYLKIGIDDLSKIDHESGCMEFETEDGFIFVVEPMVSRHLSMSKLFRL